MGKRRRGKKKKEPYIGCGKKEKKVILLAWFVASPTLQTVLEFMKVACEVYNRIRCLSDLRSSKVEVYWIRFAEEPKLWYN